MDSDVPTNLRTPLEVPVFTYHDARSVVALGGKRIELNALGSYPQGGLTPSIDQLMSCGREVPYTIRIMIRPRGPPAQGPDFIYTDDEFQQMYDAIAEFKETNHMYVIRGDGFVFGILKYEDTPTGKKLVVDVERCQILAELARPYTCIFHRAFDLIAESENPTDINHGLGDLQRAGMHGVLTSGGPGNYLDHIDLISDIVRWNAGELDIIIGGGVRSSNIAAAKEVLDIGKTRVWMHSSCITGSEPVVDNEELTLLASELGLFSVD